ncbi:MAG: hypothetical protein ACQ9MH_12515 [Nitrospinales bacterium]
MNGPKDKKPDVEWQKKIRISLPIKYFLAGCSLPILGVICQTFRLFPNLFWHGGSLVALYLMLASVISMPLFFHWEYIPVVN